jgi:hypothetical protein
MNLSVAGIVGAPGKVLSLLPATPCPRSRFLDLHRLSGLIRRGPPWRKTWGAQITGDAAARGLSASI